MSKIYLSILIFMIATLPCLAQFSDVNLDTLRGVTVGIERNEYLLADYGFSKGLHVGFKHTVKPEDEKNQTFQLNASYTARPKFMDITVNPFLTTSWNMDYTSFGCKIQVMSSLFTDRLQFGASIIPYYDTDLKYRSCWEAGISASIHNEIRIFAEVSDKPLYRIAYKRAYLGFDFKVANLQVKPSLQIPIYDSGKRLRHSKICISAAYTFNSRKNK